MRHFFRVIALLSFNIVVSNGFTHPGYGFERPEGILSMPCPEGYNWSYDSGSSCCSSFLRADDPTKIVSFSGPETSCDATNSIPCPRNNPEQKCRTRELELAPKSSWTSKSTPFWTQNSNEVPENAYDGNLATVFHPETDGIENWIEIDMQSPVIVARIELWFRLQEFSLWPRQNGMEFRVGMDVLPDTSLSLLTNHNTLCGTNEKTAPFEGSFEIVCSPAPIKGRYITVQRPRTPKDFFEVAEIKVYSK